MSISSDGAAELGDIGNDVVDLLGFEVVVQLIGGRVEVYRELLESGVVVVEVGLHELDPLVVEFVPLVEQHLVVAGSDCW